MQSKTANFTPDADTWWCRPNNVVCLCLDPLTQALYKVREMDLDATLLTVATSTPLIS